MPRIPRKWRGLIGFVGVLAVCCAIGAVTGPIWLPAVGRSLVLQNRNSSENPVTADAVGIPGSPWISSAISSDLTMAASDLIRQHRARLVVMTCGTAYGISGCEQEQEDLVTRGGTRLPLRAVPLTSSPSDVESAAMLAEMVRAGATSAIILASPLESRRLNRVYQREGNKRGIKVTVIAVPDPNFDPAQWWRVREGRKAVLFELCQWVGIP